MIIKPKLTIDTCKPGTGWQSNVQVSVKVNKEQKKSTTPWTRSQYINSMITKESVSSQSKSVKSEIDTAELETALFSKNSYLKKNEPTMSESPKKS